MPSSDNRGGLTRFVTFEGPEGAGKSTQIKRLEAALVQLGYKCITTREPGGTPLGEALRDILLTHDGSPMGAEAELLLMFAARAEHLRTVIEPALAHGCWVLCDRFTDATYAYQGGGRGIPDARIEIIEQWVQGTCRPDLTLLMDLPVTEGLDRVRRRGGGTDRFEAEGQEFLIRVREAYLRRAARHSDRYAQIDARLSPDGVHRAILSAVSDHFAELEGRW